MYQSYTEFYCHNSLTINTNSTQCYKLNALTGHGSTMKHF